MKKITKKTIREFNFGKTPITLTAEEWNILMSASDDAELEFGKTCGKSSKTYYKSKERNQFVDLVAEKIA